MAAFVFEAPSDEEIDESQSEDEEQEHDEQEEDEVEDKPKAKHKQSPWDFAAYSESVAEEHARRSTTSIDHKISKLLQRHPSVVPAAAKEDVVEQSDSESDRQVITPSYSI